MGINGTSTNAIMNAHNELDSSFCCFAHAFSALAFSMGTEKASAAIESRR